MQTITETTASATEDDYHQIMRQTAAVLILIGIVELLYGFIKAPKGEIKFDVFGLLVGLAIYFGGWRLRSAVRWLACMSISAGIVVLFQPVLLMPMSLTLAQLRLHPLAVAAYYMPLVVTLGLAIYIVRQMGRPPVLAARADAGRKVRDMRIPLALGLVAAIGSSVIQYKLLNSDDARRAAHLAAAQMGPAYSYYTNQLHFLKARGETTVSAGVQAWNDKQVLHVPVQWKR